MPEDWEEECYEEDWDNYYPDDDDIWELEREEFFINVLEPQLNSLNGRD